MCDFFATQKPRGHELCHPDWPGEEISSVDAAKVVIAQLSSLPTSIAAGMVGSVSVAAVFSGAVRHYLLTFSVDLCCFLSLWGWPGHLHPCDDNFLLQRFRCLARASSLQPLSLQHHHLALSPLCRDWKVYSIQHHPRPVFTHWHTHSGTRSIPTSGSLLQYINQSCFVMAACTLVIMLIEN